MLAIRRSHNNLFLDKSDRERCLVHWYLIHGAVSSPLTWSQQLRILPRVIRATLPPLRDVAASQLIDAWADTCLGELTEPSIVMGHSLGGAIAQLMALKCPTLVRGLVLVGTGPRLPVNPALLQALKHTPRQALERIVRWSLSSRIDSVFLSNSLSQVQTYDVERAYREFLACDEFDLSAQLRDVACPVALVGADEDRMTPIALMQEFHQVWPTAPLFQVQNAGHMMMLEQPKQFNDIILRIMRDFGWE
ncbi:MAG: alpha/beta hydrolase [Sulfobacillus acidophilus]|uniref:Alpha/beta hydrolase n=1 Tax=Sulfobacillus acidophilus TaxID=53633 RepID=A0A2T2WDW3_9FIRM|nr:MAG: alpha/beta hydrolase [Sulfobacillus acidophilus]